MQAAKTPIEIPSAILARMRVFPWAKFIGIRHRTWTNHAVLTISDHPLRLEKSSLGDYLIFRPVERGGELAVDSFKYEHEFKPFVLEL